MNGQFYLDLSAAAVANGNSWTLVNHSTLNESYGSDFSVTSTLGTFTESPAGTWKRTDGDNTWTFTEGTGVLSLAVTPADPLLAWISTPHLALALRQRPPGWRSAQRRHRKPARICAQERRSIRLQPRHPADRERLRDQPGLHLPAAASTPPAPPRPSNTAASSIPVPGPTCPWWHTRVRSDRGHHRPPRRASSKSSSPCRKAQRQALRPPASGEMSS